MIEFAWPWIYLLLPLPWLVRRFAPPASNPPGAALRVPFYQHLIGLCGGQNNNPGFSMGTLLMAWCAWLLLLTASARPQWLGEPINLPISGRDVMLAIDISGSMEIPDFDLQGEQVTRLRVVKQLAGQFITRRTGDRIGLILFGSRAYLQTPLTFDRNTVAAMLRDADIGLAGKETAIGDAIGLAIKRLRDAPKQQRVLVLLTDGANTAGTVEPRQAANLAADAGLRIHTIGVGAERMRVNTLFGSRLVNPSRDLDEALLKEIADTTGGLYFRAKNTRGLQSIYEQLDRLEPVASDSRVFRPVRALYMWPLGTALALVLGLILWRVHRWPSLTGKQTGKA
jgi:Ca-activated chloride channel family protein